MGLAFQTGVVTRGAAAQAVAESGPAAWGIPLDSLAFWFSELEESPKGLRWEGVPRSQGGKAGGLPRNTKEPYKILRNVGLSTAHPLLVPEPSRDSMVNEWLPQGVLATSLFGTSSGDGFKGNRRYIESTFEGTSSDLCRCAIEELHSLLFVCSGYERLERALLKGSRAVCRFQKSNSKTLKTAGAIFESCWKSRADGLETPRDCQKPQ